jgi:hypothetical protein
MDGSWSFPSLPAYLGSRKSAFIRDRRKSPVLYADANSAVFAHSAGGSWIGHRGSTGERDAAESWAEDSGSVSGYADVCGRWEFFSSGIGSQLRSTAQRVPGDEHRWSPGGVTHDEAVHDLRDCAGVCPTVWVLRAEYNRDPSTLESPADDQWKQPRTLVVLERDDDQALPGLRDPWTLPLVRSRAPRKQAAISSAITYYHRHMEDRSLAWKEPPNLFNPFWRATLVAPDVDGQDLDISRALQASDPSFESAWRALVRAGFRGIQ